MTHGYFSSKFSGVYPSPKSHEKQQPTFYIPLFSYCTHVQQQKLTIEIMELIVLLLVPHLMILLSWFSSGLLDSIGLG